MSSHLELEVKDLQVSYGPIKALDGVSMTAETGQLTSVVGANGAGKSTLLMTIAGALKPQSGDVLYKGKSLLGVSPEDRVRQGIALIPERRRIFSTLTVKENLDMGTITRRDSNAVSADMEKVLERFPVLRKRYRSSAAKLSGGEQQQLAIARSILTGPSLLLVDEPSLGLAPKLVSEVLDSIASLRDEGVTIVLVEQNARRAVAVSDKAYLLSNGRMVSSDTGDEMGDKEALMRTYFGDTPKSVDSRPEGD